MKAIQAQPHDVRMAKSALDHFDDRLGLDYHLILIEQMEALDKQFMASAFDVKDAEASARL